MMNAVLRNSRVPVLAASYMNGLAGFLNPSLSGAGCYFKAEHSMSLMIRFLLVFAKSTSILFSFLYNDKLALRRSDIFILILCSFSFFGDADSSNRSRYSLKSHISGISLFDISCFIFKSSLFTYLSSILTP